MGSLTTVLFCYFFLMVCNLFFIFYIKLMLPSLMTEKSFWTSEQRLLTSNWTKIFFFNESKDLLLYGEQIQIPVIRVMKRRRYRGKRCLVRIRRRVSKSPLPSVLLANVQSLENKLCDLRSRLSNQQDMKNWNILYFPESWLNDDMDNIELACFSVYRQGKFERSLEILLT